MMQIAGGTEFPQNIAAKQIECLSATSDDFTKVIDDVALSLAFTDVTREDVFYSILDSTPVGPVDCFKDDLLKIYPFYLNRQNDIISAASKYSA